MAPQARKRSRYDLPEPEPGQGDFGAASLATPLADPGTFEAQSTLRAAFDEAGRSVQAELMHVHADMARRMDSLSGRLLDARREIERLTRDMDAMRNDRVHALLQQARERLGGM
jgi:hypothetical protein